MSTFVNASFYFVDFESFAYILTNNRVQNLSMQKSSQGSGTDQFNRLILAVLTQI